ncbi:hypothetical protein D3C78_1165240 [compost metagenome]
MNRRGDQCNFPSRILNCVHDVRCRSCDFNMHLDILQVNRLSEFAGHVRNIDLLRRKRICRFSRSNLQRRSIVFHASNYLSVQFANDDICLDIHRDGDNYPLAFSCKQAVELVLVHRHRSNGLVFALRCRDGSCVFHFTVHKNARIGTVIRQSCA